MESVVFRPIAAEDCSCSVLFTSFCKQLRVASLKATIGWFSWSGNAGNVMNSGETARRSNGAVAVRLQSSTPVKLYSSSKRRFP